eukprot:GHRQ01012616.1.p1 GENE.GHRQ01012616.1~~GHRQ01012616.1.p1  ORF type:complete len:162 (+),score=56.23 GHRQ01012616.1:197-682(+)
MEFATQQKLAEYLGRIEPHYTTYAGPLWRYGVRTSRELANNSVDDLVLAGIMNRLHAGNIKATAAGAGAAAAAMVAVHIFKGGEQLPTMKVPLMGNEVYVQPLETASDASFKQVAVKDSSSMEAPQYRKFDNYSIKVEPGQEIYIKAKAKTAGQYMQGSRA